jgi:N-acyl homoserine lactone hydrolase
MTKLWTIRPLCYGEFPAIEKSAFTFGCNYGVKFSLPAVGWLLQSGDDAILVDTGPGDPETAHPCHSKYLRSPEQVPDAAIRAAGAAPEKLKLVVFTHLHWDHACNLEFFPEARFVMQFEELKTAVDPVLPHRRDYEFGIPGVRPPWLGVWDRLQPARGEVTLVPGIHLVPKPGHTPGMQCVVVETAGGPHLITGDLAPLYENVGIGQSAPILPGIHTDLVACERSLEWVRSFQGVILPSHDWEVFKHPLYPVA